MHFYGWKRGLKTGIYYLRTRPSANAIQFTIDAGTAKRESPFPRVNHELTFAEAKDNAAAAKLVATPVKTQVASPSADSLVAPLKQVSIATTASAAPVPSPSVSVSKSNGNASRPESPGPSEEEEISYEEAKRRADERAEAALQCSIDNKDACMMCSG
jgi:ribonucleoside-diphosphate reductase subunit M1